MLTAGYVFAPNNTAFSSISAQSLSHYPKCQSQIWQPDKRSAEENALQKYFGTTPEISLRKPTEMYLRYICGLFLAAALIKMSVLLSSLN